MPAKILFFLAGFLILSIGISSFLICGLPLLPFDTVVRAFMMEKDMGVRKARTFFDLISIVLSTVISALLMGTFVSHITKWINGRMDIKPRLSWLGKLI